jgi:hypothetical protein
MYRANNYLSKVLSLVSITYLSFPSSVWSCATCTVGDPSLTVMGTEKNFAGRWRFSTDFLYRDETIGVEGINQREVSESRLALGISYAPTKDWVFSAQVPIVRKELTNINLSTAEQTAIGDVVLSAKQFLYQDKPMQTRHAAGWLAGLRLPTGQEQNDERGEPLDIDVQPGAGNWVPSLGGWYGYYRFPWFGYFSSTLHYPVGEGYAEFEEGTAVLTTAMLQYAPNYTVALQLGLDTRWSEKHRYDGVADEDSGGFIGFLSPGLVFNMMEDLLFYATVQVPVIDDLNGEHEENTVYRFGFTYDFASH